MSSPDPRRSEDWKARRELLQYASWWFSEVATPEMTHAVLLINYTDGGYTGHKILRTPSWRFFPARIRAAELQARTTRLLPEVYSDVTTAALMLYAGELCLGELTVIAKRSA